jgi:hypothetical protein
MTPSVYVIDETLSSLMLMREEEGITEEECKAIDSQIEAWMAAEVAKVTNVRAYILQCKMMRDGHRKEKEAQERQEDAWDARLKRLENIVQYVMEAQQRRRCEGPTGVLRLQGNGGKRELVISDPSLLPDEYKRVVVTFSLSQWNRLVREHPTFSIIGDPPLPHIDTSAVRKTLEYGDAVPGAHLAERGQHLRVE